jgi:hypothetical protein
MIIGNDLAMDGGNDDMLLMAVVIMIDFLQSSGSHVPRFRFGLIKCKYFILNR